MKPSVSWKIFYPDSTFSNLDGNPEDAPPVGVIVIKQLSAEGKWELQAISDYYIWNFEANEWWLADAAGFWQYMFKPGFKVVKFGTNLTEVEFEKRMAEAREDTSNGMPRIT